jgi:hypothetical protein
VSDQSSVSKPIGHAADRTDTYARFPGTTPLSPAFCVALRHQRIPASCTSIIIEEGQDRGERATRFSADERDLAGHANSMIKRVAVLMRALLGRPDGHPAGGVSLVKPHASGRHLASAFRLLGETSLPCELHDLRLPCRIAVHPYVSLTWALGEEGSK